MWHRLTFSATVREGLAAGLVGQLAAVVWALGVDLVTARPFALPRVLGGAILRQFGGGASPAAGVALFAVLAVAVSLAVGCGAALLLQAAQRRPSLIMAGALAFVLLQLAVCIITLILSAMGAGSRMWFHLAGSDVVQSLVIGGFLLRRHPEFRALLTQEDPEDLAFESHGDARGGAPSGAPGGAPVAPVDRVGA